VVMATIIHIITIIVNKNLCSEKVFRLV
jgi:hypothetical protein